MSRRKKTIKRLILDLRNNYTLMTIRN
uniref:Uncharacterized protein n=1 Tax=Rhizophora mucronata TaxID=61149 RepID=A0A2P2PB22_RHIMU